MICNKDSEMYGRPGNQPKAVDRTTGYLHNYDAGSRNRSVNDTHGYERHNTSRPRGFDTRRENHESSACSSVDVLLLHGDLGIWAQVVQAISAKGWTYHSLTSFPALQDALAEDVKVILIDAAFLPALDMQPRWLHSQRHNQPTLFILSEHCDIGTRIRALQTGAKKLFLEPIDLNALIHEIEEYIEPKVDPRIRTLIFADDEAVAAPAANILGNGTSNTLVLTDPLSIIDTIWRFRPDLILIMEPHSTNVDGIVLTKLIREREESTAVPIILLSHDYNSEKALQALQAGADDVLSLSMYPNWLSTVVACRIERTKAISSAGIHATDGHPVELPDRRSMRARIEPMISDHAVDGWHHAVIVIALESRNRRSRIPSESHVNHLITITNESLGPILQVKDYVARIGTGHLALLVRRESIQALKQLADLITEIINYRHTLHEIPVNAFGVGLVMLEYGRQNAEVLLKQVEFEADTNYELKRKKYCNDSNSSAPHGFGVKEGNLWLKDEFLRAIDAGTMAFREQRYVCSDRKHPQIKTIELKPEFEFPGSPVDIYRRTPLSRKISGPFLFRDF